MQDYLIQVKFEPKWFASMIANPQNREEIMRSIIEKFGGKIKGFWFSFGEYDVATVWSMPDNVSLKAITMAIHATGNIKDGKYTPLLSTEESIEVMKKAQTVDSKQLMVK